MITAFFIGYVVGVASFCFYVEPLYKLIDETQAKVLAFFKRPPLTHGGVVMVLASAVTVAGALLTYLVNLLFL